MKALLTPYDINAQDFFQYTKDTFMTDTNRIPQQAGQLCRELGVLTGIGVL